ncbi:MAG: DUF1501 domain-containing protein [Phycisphaerae bacterium]|nr:DUF1501 domain-containing protein [Phycisphaerae bacterium]
MVTYMRIARTDFLDVQPIHDRVLVVVFLRGGADGLSIVPPYGDDSYYSARPTLGVAKSKVIRLDDRFGMHESLRPLMPLWEAGALRIVHGAGTADTSHSHFEAQDYLEHGGATGAGWIGRWLRARPNAVGPLAAIAIGTTLPESLRGAPGGVVIQRVSDFRLVGDDPSLLAGLSTLYADHGGALGETARAALEAEARLRTLRAMPEAATSAYPDTVLGRGLREIARLVKSDTGLVVTTVDAVGGALGWDTHFVQSEAIRPLIDDLGSSIAAFREDLGADAKRVTIVAMTEFGRRVAENTSLGTDHGGGSVAFVIDDAPPGGAGITCGWTSLDAAQLTGPGDVPVTTDLREVLSEIVARHDPSVDVRRMFASDAAAARRSPRRCCNSPMCTHT